MFRINIPLAASIALLASAGANAQVTTTQQNDNVTKVDGTINGATVRGITNPAQTRVRVEDPTLGRADVRIKPGDATTTPLSNVEINSRVLNDNVTKIEGTADGITATGINNPAQTHIHGRAVDGSKVDVRIKPPK